jgi:holliday junction DNA helicase RuvA
MIDFVVGKTKWVSEKSILVMVNGIGFSIHVPNAQKIQEDADIELYTHMHWNQEKGPSLFGFQSELDKTIFLMIIECPKVGPSIALNVLSGIGGQQFLEAVVSQNEAALSAIGGVGAKTAEKIIVHLKRKASKLISSGKISKSDSSTGLVQWQQISDVLLSLNYTKPEITQALGYLTETYSGKEISLDMLIRSSLSFLSKNR